MLFIRKTSNITGATQHAEFSWRSCCVFIPHSRISPQRLITVTLIFTMLAASTAFALDDTHWRTGNSLIEKGIAYLQSTQNEDGSWSPEPGPAITALAVAVMLDRPDIPTDDTTINKAIDYILSKCQPDGGIHDGFLENYNTSICIAALARVNDRPDAAAAINKAQAYLSSLQWNNQNDPQGNPIDPSHAYYGGAGYGKHGRPDMSNTQFMLEGLYESGFDCNDPVFIRAMAFISRCQGTKANTEFADKINQDGGFIYATSVNKDLIGMPQSMASPEQIDRAKQGLSVSGLRTYGSMTYAGFKSYLYANLDRDDPRVLAALNWARHNYTLEQNPGMPESVKMQGYYYYLVTFSRALAAWGETTITTTDSVQHDWANDLIDALAKHQLEDGSWTNEADRWMEGDKNLATAYALTALVQAAR